MIYSNFGDYKEVEEAREKQILYIRHRKAKAIMEFIDLNTKLAKEEQLKQEAKLKEKIKNKQLSIIL